MDSVVNWLLAVGCMLVGGGVSLWGLTDFNKSIALWIVGFPGCLCLLVAASLEIQKLATPTVDIEKRPYVSVSQAEATNVPGQPPTVLVVIKNTGRTPAVDLTWRTTFHLRPANEGNKVSLDPSAIGVPQTLAPSGTLSFIFTFPIWNDNADDNLRSGQGSIFALGEIRYKDGSGILRRTDYLLKSQGRFGDGDGGAPGLFTTVRMTSD